MITSRNIKYGFCIVYNLIRLPLKTMLCFGRAKFSKIELIRPRVKMIVYGVNSRLTVNKANILSNTLLYADGGEIHIGKNVFINRNCNIVAQKYIKIDDECTIGPNVCIYDHDHTFGTKKMKMSNSKDQILLLENVFGLVLMLLSFVEQKLVMIV